MGMVFCTLRSTQSPIEWHSAGAFATGFLAISTLGQLGPDQNAKNVTLPDYCLDKSKTLFANICAKTKSLRVVLSFFLAFQTCDMKHKFIFTFKSYNIVEFLM